MSYWLYTKYMYFHFRCDDMGFDLVSNLFKRIAIQEMMHVEQLAERILFLKGEVEMKVAVLELVGRHTVDIIDRKSVV